MINNVIDLHNHEHVKEHLLHYLVVNALLNLTIYEPNTPKFQKSHLYLTAKDGLQQDMDTLHLDHEFKQQMLCIVKLFLDNDIPFPNDIEEPILLNTHNTPDLAYTQALLQDTVQSKNLSSYYKSTFRRYAQDDDYYEKHPNHMIDLLYPKLLYANTVWDCIILRETHGRSQFRG